MSVTTVRCCC